MCHFCTTAESCASTICAFVNLRLIHVDFVTVGQKWKEIEEVTKLEHTCIDGWSSCRKPLKKFHYFPTLVGAKQKPERSGIIRVCCPKAFSGDYHSQFF